MARQVKLVEAEILRPIDQKTRDKIAAGLKRDHLLELNVTAEEWDRLEGLLHHFQRSFVDWDGYLNKGEMAKVSGIASKAAKLLTAIDEAKDFGLGKILDYELAPITSEQLLDVLSKLAQIDPSSPKIEDGGKQVGIRYQDDLKTDLQLELDEWWERNTGWPTETDESKITPYRYFLAQVFRTLPTEVAKDLGSSRTAVSERRRNARRLQARKRKISEAFKKLRSLQAQSDD